METVKSIRQSILVNDWAVSIDLTDAYLHVPIHSQPKKYLRVHLRSSSLPVHGLLFRNVPKSIDFHQTNGRNSSTFASTCHIPISVPRRLADKRFDLQPTNISHNLLPSNGTKSRFHAKSKEVRFDTSTEIHIHRQWYRVRVPADRVDSLFLTIKTFLSQTQISAQTFLSLLGKLSAAADRSSRQTSPSTSANVSIICLETSHSSPQSSGSDQQYDSIPFEMVDGHQLIHSRNAYSSSRSQCIPMLVITDRELI